MHAVDRLKSDSGGGKTAQCRFQCGVAEVPSAVACSWLFVELFMLKWSGRPRVMSF